MKNPIVYKLTHIPISEVEALRIHLESQGKSFAHLGMIGKYISHGFFESSLALFKLTEKFSKGFKIKP